MKFESSQLFIYLLARLWTKQSTSLDPPKYKSVQFQLQLTHVFMYLWIHSLLPGHGISNLRLHVWTLRRYDCLRFTIVISLKLTKLGGHTPTSMRRCYHIHAHVYMEGCNIIFPMSLDTAQLMSLSSECCISWPKNQRFESSHLCQRPPWQDGVRW